jgi:DNA-binding transcriptional LysR family regulator
VGPGLEQTWSAKKEYTPRRLAFGASAVAAKRVPRNKEAAESRVGQLRIGIGICAAISEDFLATAFALLRKDAPRTVLNVIVSDNDLIVPALRNGDLDVGNGALPNGPSYRAHPRLYLSGGSRMSALTPLLEVERTFVGRAENAAFDPEPT